MILPPIAIQPFEIFLPIETVFSLKTYREIMFPTIVTTMSINTPSNTLTSQLLQDCLLGGNIKIISYNDTYFNVYAILKQRFSNETLL